MDRRRVAAWLPWVRPLGPLLVLAVCGCADVRVVREAPNGGQIALPANSNCWPMYYRDRAEKLMQAKCPEGYRIDREEFVWNGREGTEGHRYYNSYFGYTDPDDENAPYLRKEYRITFHAALPASPRPGSGATPQSGQSTPSAPPPSPSRKGKDELPPPRLLNGVH